MPYWRTMETRQKLAKFRIRAHRLPIELGHYKKPDKIPRELRFCEKCDFHIGDEFHALMRCPEYLNERNNLFLALNQISMFSRLSTDKDKFIFIMSLASADHDFHELVSPLVVKIIDTNK